MVPGFNIVILKKLASFIDECDQLYRLDAAGESKGGKAAAAQAEGRKAARGVAMGMWGTFILVRVCLARARGGWVPYHSLQCPSCRAPKVMTSTGPQTFSWEEYARDFRALATDDAATGRDVWSFVKEFARDARDEQAYALGLWKGKHGAKSKGWWKFGEQKPAA